MALQQELPAPVIQQAAVDKDQGRVLQGTFHIEPRGHPAHADALLSRDEHGDHAAGQLGRLLFGEAIHVLEAEDAAVGHALRLLPGEAADPRLAPAGGGPAGGDVDCRVVLPRPDGADAEAVLGPVGAAGDAALPALGQLVQLPLQQAEKLRRAVAPLEKDRGLLLVENGHLGVLPAEQGAEQGVLVPQVLLAAAESQSPVQRLPDALHPGGDENGVEPDAPRDDVRGHVAEHRVILVVLQVAQGGLQLFDGVHDENVHLVMQQIAERLGADGDVGIGHHGELAVQPAGELQGVQDVIEGDLDLHHGEGELPQQQGGAAPGDHRVIPAAEMFPGDLRALFHIAHEHVQLDLRVFLRKTEQERFHPLIRHDPKKTDRTVQNQTPPLEIHSLILPYGQK